MTELYDVRHSTPQSNSVKGNRDIHRAQIATQDLHGLNSVPSQVVALPSSRAGSSGGTPVNLRGIPRMSREPRKTQVYFIKPVGLDGPIKIGCSHLPTARLINLMVWCPFRLEIIGSTPGDYTDERYLHRCFAHLHSHGEWFYSTRALLEEIGRVLEFGLPYARSNLKPTGDVRRQSPRSERSRAMMSASMREAWARRKKMLAEKAGSNGS